MNKSGRVLLTGNTGSGKSQTALRYCMQILESNRVAFTSNTYKAVDELIETIREKYRFEAKNFQIVVAQGKDKACNPACGHKKIYTLGNLKGIFTSREIPKEYCCYLSLKEAAEKTANLVLTHVKFLEKNEQSFKGFDIFVNDECDELLKSSEYLLLRIRGSQKPASHYTSHLERQEDKIEPLLKSLNKLHEGKQGEKFEKAYYLVQLISKELTDFPSIEARSINKKEFTKGSSSVEEFLAYGIRTAHQEIESFVRVLNDPDLIERLQQAFNELSIWDFAPLPSDLKRSMISFWEVAKEANRFYCVSRNPSDSHPEGYLAISLVSGIGDIAKSFKGRIDISAFPPAYYPESIPRISFEDTTNYPKNQFALFGNEKRVREFIEESLRSCNILGVTTGKLRAEGLKKIYKGNLIGEFEENELTNELSSGKGHLIWNYFGSKSHKAVNYLHIFDMILVFNYIADAQADIKSNPEIMNQEALNDLMQMFGRVLRADKEGNYRKRTVVFVGSDLKNAFDYTRRVYPNSQFRETPAVASALDFVKEFNEPYTFPRSKANLDTELKVVKRVINGKEYYSIEGHVPVEENEKAAKLEGKKIPVSIDVENARLV